MKQEDPQFKLRLKPELKEQLEESAKANTRTLGAEIVARLEQSFDSKSRDSSFQREMDLLVLGLTSKAELLKLRADLVAMKKENLEVRSEALFAEQARITPGSLKTGADFERAEKVIAAMRAVERDAQAAADELAALTKERDVVVKALDSTRDALQAKASALEKGIADYLARNPGAPDPFAPYHQIEKARLAAGEQFSPIPDNTPEGPARSANARQAVRKKLTK